MTKKAIWSKGMKESLAGPAQNIKKRSDVIPIKKIRNVLGFASVYLIGEQCGRPLKLGRSNDPERRLSKLIDDRRLCCGNMVDLEPLILHHCDWVRSTGYSSMLEKECHALLNKANRCLSGEWFDIDVEWGKKVIQVAADKLGYQLYTTHQVRELLAAKKRLDEEALAREIDLAVGRWAKEPLKSLSF